MAEEEELDELEKEFKDLLEGSAGQALDEKLIEARAALKEACKIADEHGIPFRGGISFMGNTYVPKRFYEKFKDLDREWVEDLTDVYGLSGSDRGGWQHSNAVCW